MQTRRTFIARSAALTALAATPFRSRAASLPVVRLGVYSNTIFYLPLWIAKEKGFFEQAGVDFDFVEGQSIHQTTDALLDGSAPLAMLAPELAFHERRGADRVRIIAGNANRPPHFLIAQPRFRRVSDLRGATFGVISLTEGTTFLVQKMAARAGLKPNDYKIEEVGSAPTRVRLLDEGKIDAALQPFPLSYDAERKGFSNLGWVGNVEPNWQFSVMLANRAWLAENRSVAGRVVAAAVRGRKFMNENPEESAQIAARHIRSTEALARRALDDALRLQIMDENSRWSERGLKAIYDNLQRVGLLPKHPPFRLADYVDAGPLAGQGL